MDSSIDMKKYKENIAKHNQRDIDKKKMRADALSHVLNGFKDDSDGHVERGSIEVAW